MQPQVTSLHIYPLKSAQGIQVQQIEVDSSGPQYDREWMLVDEQNRFVTQRTQPQMSQIKTSLTNEHLVLGANGLEDLKVDLSLYGKENFDVKIFSNLTSATHLSTKYDQWFSDFLKTKVKLIRSPKGPTRETSGRNGPKTELKFADGYPFLLANEDTLKELNSKLDSPVEMNRFRPNIVTKGAPANTEDKWSQFKIGNVNFLSVKACTRCVIINIDPDSGTKSNEVTKALSQYRTKDGSVIFGNNLSHTNTGLIKVSDSLENIT